METFNFKKLFTDKTYGWNTGFKFEIIYSNAGVARIYINDRKTKYTAGGYGYDKESSVIATMVNDLIGPQKYKKGIYGHLGGWLEGGTGFDSIKDSFESKRGCKLARIYSGLNSNVYEIKFGKGVIQ